MTNPPVPATPLDVEACMNPERLRNLADRILNMADGRADRDPASLRREAEFVRALASALPGMGKDSERLDALESWTKGDQTICPPGNHGGENTHWLLARDDDAKGDRYGIWSETTEGPTLREAIDAARAAQPEETSVEAISDRELLDWLTAEGWRYDPVAQLTVKRNYDRSGSEWVNVTGNVRAIIAAARAAQPQETSADG